MSAYLIAAMVAVLPLGGVERPLWTYQEQSGIVCSPSLADINARPGLETILTGRGGEVACLGADGRLVWRSYSPDEIWTGAAILDLDGDGALEIVTADQSGHVLCLRGDGSVLWTHRLAGRVTWSSLVATSEGGGHVFVAQTDGTVTALGASGEEQWEAKAPSGCFSLPTLADVDGDGTQEMLVPCEYGHLFCVGAEGRVRWTVRPTKEGLAGPVCADLDGDGSVEVLVGAGDGTLFALRGASGELVWQFKSAGNVDASVSVADLNGDGRPEIVFTSMFERVAYCLDAEGQELWRFQTPGKVPYAPAIGDVDGDGALEVLLPDRNGFVHFLSASGQLEKEMRVEGGMNASPALADLEGDGSIEMVLATEPGMAYCFRLGKYGGAGSVPWPVHRFDMAQTADATKAARFLSAEHVTGTRAAPAAVQASAAASSNAVSNVSGGEFFVGPNEAAATALNQTGEKVRLVLSVSDPEGVLHSTAVDSEQAEIEARLEFPVLASGTYRISAALRRVSDGAALGEKEIERSVALFGPDRDLVTANLGGVAAAVEGLREARTEDADDLGGRAAALSGRLERMAARMEGFGEMDREERAEVIASAGALREDAVNLSEVAKFSAEWFARGPDERVVVWQSNPWERLETLSRPEGPPTEEVRVATLAGEWESVALNLSNLTSRTRYVRVRPHVASSEVSGLPWDKVTVREVTEIAYTQAEGPPLLFADYLPETNEAYYFVLPPWQSRQVWLTLDTRGLEPGEYVLPLMVAEAAPERSGQVVNVRVRVRAVAIPDPNPFQSCWWSYYFGDRQPEWGQFQAEHYINLFPGVGIPLGEFDAEGNMVKAPEFSGVDAYVAMRRSAGQARFLFGEPFIRNAASFDIEEPWQAQGRLVEMTAQGRRMYAQWLPVVVEHLKSIGLGYQDWAFYPWDEPYRGPTCLIASLSREAKRIDPSVRFYIDFISGHDVYDLELVLPYYDLWCPQPDFAFESEWGREVTRRLVEAGQEVVCYGIYGAPSTPRKYRLMPWNCAKYGLVGAGGWVLITQAYNAWAQEPGAAAEAHSIAGGWESLYPTKRLEAYREGVEDYLYLYVLAQLADRAEAGGLEQEAKEAQALREEAIEAVTAAEGDWETIRRYREELGEAIESLASKVE